MRWSGVEPDTGTFVFRPRTGLVVSLAWLLISVLWVVVEARNGIGAVLSALPLIATLAVGMLMLFGRPSVTVSRSTVLIRNVLRDVLIPFDAVADIGTQYCLKITDRAGRSYQAWAAPAPSRFSTTRVTDEELRALALQDQDSVPASATLRSDAGAVAATISVRMNAYRGSGAPALGNGTAIEDSPARGAETAGPDSESRVRVSWAWPWIGALVGALVLTMVVGVLG